MPTAHTTSKDEADMLRRNSASVDSATLSAAGAQRTRGGRKVRGDARDQLLTPDQQVELITICGSAGTQNRINEFLAKCGLKPLSKSNQHDVWHRYNKVALDMGIDIEKLRLLQEMAKSQGVPLAKLLGDNGLVAVQEIMAGVRAANVEYGAKLILTGMDRINAARGNEISAEKNELKRGDQELNRRRLELLEKKSGQADEAKKTLADVSLTPEQKLARYKAIFGM